MGVQTADDEVVALGKSLELDKLVCVIVIEFGVSIELGESVELGD